MAEITSGLVVTVGGPDSPASVAEATMTANGSVELRKVRNFLMLLLVL